MSAKVLTPITNILQRHPSKTYISWPVDNIMVVTKAQINLRPPVVFVVWLLHSSSYRLSVCLSVKRVDCDKTEESSAQIFTPPDRSFILVFCDEECLVGGDTSTWNFEMISFSTIVKWKGLNILEHSAFENEHALCNLGLLCPNLLQHFILT